MGLKPPRSYQILRRYGLSEMHATRLQVASPLPIYRAWIFCSEQLNLIRFSSLLSVGMTRTYLSVYSVARPLFVACSFYWQRFKAPFEPVARQTPRLQQMSATANNYKKHIVIPKEAFCTSKMRIEESNSKLGMQLNAMHQCI